MPVIARFYGILIKMYFSQSEHGVPHFHAVYGEFNGVFWHGSKNPGSQFDTFRILHPNSEKPVGHRRGDHRLIPAG